MNAQQKADMAPILARFPLTIIQDDFSPIIYTSFEDPEGDTVVVAFDIDGRMDISTVDSDYLVFDKWNMLNMARACVEAQHLLMQWSETPSGQKWIHEPE